MVLNYLLTIGIVGAIVIGGKRYYDANIKGKVFDDFTEEENPRADFDMIVREVNAEFSRMTKRNINDDRLTREELEKKRKHIATLRDKRKALCKKLHQGYSCCKQQDSGVRREYQ